ncbi:MAG: hypothetical protein AAGD09_25715, partial [Cyanobacteria bacterium P01_F01_bin.56]
PVHWSSFIHRKSFVPARTLNNRLNCLVWGTQSLGLQRRHNSICPKSSQFDQAKPRFKTVFEQIAETFSKS